MQRSLVEHITKPVEPFFRRGEISLFEYTRTLKQAGVTGEDLTRTVKNIPLEADPGLERLVLTRRALQELVNASDAGVNTEPFVRDAARIALQEGRTKVGPFGQIKHVFESLRSRVDTQIRKSQFDRSDH